MAGNVHTSSQKRATEQWHHLRNSLAQVANVELVEPQCGVPDMVFTANAGLYHDGNVVLSHFFHSERQAEEKHFRRRFREAGFNIVDLPKAIYFEGEGDALFSSEGSHLWAAYGYRTARESHQVLARILNVEVVSLHLVDPRFYHLDTCFAPLSNDYLMYYPGAFDHASLVSIESFYSREKRIVVTENDAAHFACNVINVGRNLFLNNVSRELAAQLGAMGFHVTPIALSEFIRAGGAAKCLVMGLG
jgi:ornithine--oxo-acid transaminase